MAHEIGQTVYIDASKYSSVRPLCGKITKITTTGQITVLIANHANGYNLRFDNNGREIGGSSSWNKKRLINEDAYNKLKDLAERKQRGRDARKAVDVLAAQGIGHESDKAKLLELVEAARKAIEAI